MPSVYTSFVWKNASSIKLGESFNVLRNKIEKENITYSEFSTYYDKYFDAARENVLAFDYMVYGKVLLDAGVIIDNREDQEKYNVERLVLSEFMAGYLLAKETAHIDPYEVYNNGKAAKQLNVKKI